MNRGMMTALPGGEDVDESTFESELDGLPCEGSEFVHLQQQHTAQKVTDK